MKWCTEHWAQLRKAIEDLGLSHLVAKDGASAHANVVAELEAAAQGVDPPQETYDPLMSSYWAISSRALQMGGLYLMSGDYCPLCELNKNCEPHPDYQPDHAFHWIKGCTEAQLKYCQAQGLVAPVQ
jgi:hypothetical protein